MAGRSGAEKPAEATTADARMVIRTATLSLIVDNAAEHLKRAVATVEAGGGYVAESRQWQDKGQLRATATLRVPAEKLTATLDEIRKGATRVSSETVTGQDVSEEFADLGAQLVNLRATEAELRQLMITVRERTQTASQILEIHAQVSKVRGDIDRLQGRMDYLKKMTAMSTIHLELIPDRLSDPVIEPGWSATAIAKNALRALVETLKGLAGVIIWFVLLILPLAIVLGVLAAIVFWLLGPLRRWRRTHAPAPPPRLG